MASSSPLTGVVLIDCARANASKGLAIAAQQCGYGDDIATFQAALRSACHDMGISASELSDLVADEATWRPQPGIEISPESLDKL
ncbi:hypothetical protein IQ254_28060 [Nodosilinea sp. LEGE 07088]|uniref:hypothetical protein n=1 Tax=Nodosilinea sp. LEGE 07088 TaxID=2777968 RepID=UPI0018825EBF|nr:hypothetical protein [Nodosilinea sp. LEGE 07088]MBE9141009.1 hypothetical protein [Nodosilinea sp. LEGE 07088]